MTVHMVWGLIGFSIALIFMWVYYILKTRGVRFFWYHPFLAVGVLLLILYVLESIFADASESVIQMNWSLMLYLGVPLAILAIIFFYRALGMRKKP